MAELHPPAISLRNVSKTFGGEQALTNVDLTVARGEIHGLLGENGSGKSTLIRILAGFHAPDHGGELEVDGHTVKLPLAPGQFRALGMAFVHQDLALIPSLTVVENLRIGELGTRQNWRLSWARERARARRSFASFGLDIDPAARVADLRPTDRALLAIVRAVEDLRASAGGAGFGLLVLDEPTVFLPQSGKERLFRLVREIAATQASVLFVSHDLDEVREITDRVTVLRDGCVRETVRTADTSSERLVELIVGHQLRALAATNGDAEQQPTISIRRLAGRLLADTSFDVHEGEVLGLTGLLGAGFEEVPYHLVGARPAASGELHIRGRTYELASMTPARALLAGIALLPADRQRDGTIGSLSVGDNVMLQVVDRYKGRAGLHRRRMRDEAARVLHTFDVRPPEPALPFQALSGGNQQKALLAKWLQTRPTLLLLHEPTHGVDIGARRQIFRLIRRAAADGAAVLCVSSDHEQLAMICDRVLVFARGRIGRELERADITKERITEQCYRLDDAFAVRDPAPDPQGRSG
jgi:ribose transport system ATP-binding protein